MSVRGLLYAAKDLLITHIPSKGWEVDVRHDARPPYSGPDKFVGIWCGQWEPGANIHMEQGLDEMIGATFTITFATGFAPHDKIDDEVIYKACWGVEWWARRIAAILTKYRWEWICAANDIAAAEMCECEPEPPSQVFTCPPVWAGNDPTPRLVGPDWFSAEPDDEGNFGVVMDVRFRDAKRIQDIEHVQ